MTDPQLLKEQIYQHLIAQFDQSIAAAQIAIASAKASRDNETKSSVGDKYETGRAMMQIEQQKQEQQLLKTLALRKELVHLHTQPIKNIIDRGSLIFTNQGIYYLSIGIGKIIVQDQTYYAISIAAPIGQLLFGKQAGDQFDFQGRHFIINQFI